MPSPTTGAIRPPYAINPRNRRPGTEGQPSHLEDREPSTECPRITPCSAGAGRAGTPVTRQAEAEASWPPLLAFGVVPLQVCETKLVDSR